MSNDQEKLDDIKKRIDNALENKEIPHIHFNGFVSSNSTGDIIIILENNKKPVAVLNASFTVAKTLAQKLNNVILNLERAAGQKILTTDEVNQKLAELEEKENEKH